MLELRNILHISKYLVIRNVDNYDSSILETSLIDLLVQE